MSRTVLVTGASAGIGRAVALEYAARGRPVALLARRRDRLEAVADAIRDSGGAASIHVCDVGDREALRAAVRVAEAVHGPIETAVVNAGLGHLGPLVAMTDEDVDRLLGANVHGAIETVRAVLPGMVARRRGRVALVSSVLGKTAIPACALYVASKWALVGFGRALRPELAPFGITVTTVLPGRTETDFFTTMKTRAFRAWTARRAGTGHTAEAVARVLVAATEDGRREVTVGLLNRLAVAALNLCPGTVERAMARLGAAEMRAAVERHLPAGR